MKPSRWRSGSWKSVLPRQELSPMGCAGEWGRRAGRWRALRTVQAARWDALSVSVTPFRHEEASPASSSDTSCAKCVTWPSVGECWDRHGGRLRGVAGWIGRPTQSPNGCANPIEQPKALLLAWRFLVLNPITVSRGAGRWLQSCSPRSASPSWTAKSKKSLRLSVTSGTPTGMQQAATQVSLCGLVGRVAERYPPAVPRFGRFLGRRG